MASRCGGDLADYLSRQSGPRHELQQLGRAALRARCVEDDCSAPEGVKDHEKDQPAFAEAYLCDLQGRAWSHPLHAPPGMAPTCPVGHDPDLCLHGAGRHHDGDGATSL